MSAFLPLSLLAPIFSLISGNSGGNQNLTSFFNVTAEPVAMPTDFASLFAFISSSKALQDYFKVIVLGSAFETLRRMYYSASSFSLTNWLYTTATFESEDDSFGKWHHWMMYWLSTLPNWRKFRDFTVSTSTLGLNNNGLELEDDDEDKDVGEDQKDPELRKRTRKVRYLPAYATSYRLFYKRRPVWISRVKEESRWYSDKSTLNVTILSRDRTILDSLIRDAKRAWLSARQDKIDLYANEGLSGDWRFVTSRPQRPLHSIVLDAGVKELILDDALDFLRSKQWYADRGIPFRRGYLLYGAPGSGKTSIIHSLAGELGLDIYIVSLSKAGLDDSTLNQLISNLPERCIALMEDIDAAFTHGLARDATGMDGEDMRMREARRRERGEDAEDAEDEDQQDNTTKADVTTTRVTLSGLLNALDGVSAQEGRLLFATTNRYATLDPALTRPGRMDLHVEFRLASAYQARELYKRFYLPDAHEKEGEKIRATEEGPNEGDEAVSDSGYVTRTPEKKPPSATPSSASEASGLDIVVSGTSHVARGPRLSKAKIEWLAGRFADAIPEREFSMASLQGYLMGYKTRPVQAIGDAAAWVHGKRDQAERRAKAEKSKGERRLRRKAALEAKDDDV
ncbi:P-loop containing nucleoside triphosphate hydrolase protein [Vararia minispora EC-137]|uniref:P-loop containing nucleoside triphosphate hydrolase protein n=1 Tax=Vararia minispora EC-137 TaxID=1314806 RepID=A0ACB8QQ73_9AGAM|nr:P-loop containing nucleoside triphosphate hydrolase protein [Vararia minispora EC-137]